MMPVSHSQKLWFLKSDPGFGIFKISSDSSELQTSLGTMAVMVAESPWMEAL